MWCHVRLVLFCSTIEFEPPHAFGYINSMKESRYLKLRYLLNAYFLRSPCCYSLFSTKRVFSTTDVVAKRKASPYRASNSGRPPTMLCWSWLEQGASRLFAVVRPVHVTTSQWRQVWNPISTRSIYQVYQVVFSTAAFQQFITLHLPWKQNKLYASVLSTDAYNSQVTRYENLRKRER